jgi:glycosyltransferase A (GT-A) superfamily protein (DUF2064 family)
MPQKKNNAVIAVCIQEPFEEGSSMDFGIIKGDMLRFLHQAFITDTIMHAFAIHEVDIRLYYIDSADRVQLVKIVTDYLRKKVSTAQAGDFDSRFASVVMKKQGWGKRAANVFEDCFEKGYNYVMLVGSRTPTISSAMMKRMLKMLRASDVVFGPTPEGRYYTIGMSGHEHIDLSTFDWNSPSIYSEVSEALTKQGISWSELEIWYCVERSDDLEMLARDINQFRFEGDETTCRETEIVLERILARLEP